MKASVIRDPCARPYLVRLTFFELWGFSLKLHSILRSDEDRELHDHPWTFITLMLCGGYWEETFHPDDQGPYQGRRTVKKWYGPGSLRLNRAPHPHRLELKYEVVPLGDEKDPRIVQVFEPAVTLVFMFPKWREWGFYCKDKWTPWTKFNPKRDC